MQLDYGEDDSAPPRATPQPTLPTQQDAQMLEEGEITDEESSPGGKATSGYSTSQSEEESVQMLLQPSSPSARSLHSGGLSLLDRITDAPDLLPPTASPSLPLAERLSSPKSPSTPNNTINEQQVRPNILLNQTRYDDAKDIVLDLLGWGVEPEYLVDCGVSRELIYYVFTELNLRLPSNLDTTGLLPYNPLTVKDFNFASPPPSLRDRIMKTPIPSTSTSVTHPDIRTRLGNSTTNPPAPEVDLDDIEKARKQELMARKAVQASRKARKAAIDKRQPSTTAPVAMDVDDFLKSITQTATATPPPASSLPMEVDDLPAPPTAVKESPPGLKRSPEPYEASTSKSPPPSRGTLSDAPPPPSTDCMTTNFGASMRLSPEPATRTSTIVTHIQTRRGMRRPIASDFDDLDMPPSRSNTFDNVEKKKFVSIKPVKCVIDVSDTESEDESSSTPVTPIIRTPLFPPKRSSSAVVRPQTRSRQSQASSAGTLSTANPAALESEIQRLRNQIAEAEEKRKRKKLAQIQATLPRNGASLSPVTATSAATNPSGSLATPASSLPPQTPTIPNTPVAPSDPNAMITAKGRADQSNRDSEPMSGVESDVITAVVSAAVDVDIEMSSSTQVSEVPNGDQMEGTAILTDSTATEERHENPATYDSLFSSYPLLRLSSSAPLFGGLSASPSLHSSVHSASIPDLRPLREATLLRAIDPKADRVLCQYEFPGGGICRDSSCTDVHLSKLASPLSEPNDCDTAKYLSGLYDGLPFDLVYRTLQQVSAGHPSSSLEERVAQALASIRQGSLAETPAGT